MTVAMTHEAAHATALLDGFLELVTPEGFRAELIEEEIVVSPPPGGTHEHDISKVLRQVMRDAAAEMDFSGHKGLKLERGGKCPKNYVIPDAVFAPEELRLFVDADPWMPCEGVSLVAEVTSSKPDRDRVAKRHCYARGKIPLYLLVDRAQKTVTLFSSPDAAEGVEDYLEDVRVPFGKALPLPAPFEFDLDTSELL